MFDKIIDKQIIRDRIALIRDAACFTEGSQLMDDFYSTKPAVIARAKEICKTCPVQTNCLRLALATFETIGVWGGLDEETREDMLYKVFGKYVTNNSKLVWTEEQWVILESMCVTDISLDILEKASQ